MPDPDAPSRIPLPFDRAALQRLSIESTIGFFVFLNCYCEVGDLGCYWRQFFWRSNAVHSFEHLRELPPGVVLHYLACIDSEFDVAWLRERYDFTKGLIGVDIEPAAQGCLYRPGGGPAGGNHNHPPVCPGWQPAPQYQPLARSVAIIANDRKTNH